MRVLLVLLLILILPPAFSQEDSIRHPQKYKNKKESFWSWDKVVYGGDIGATFGEVTFVNISPMIGYRLTKRLVPGISPIYQYIRIRDQGITYLETHVYGAAFSTRYYVLDYVFGHGEYQWLNGEYDYISRPGQRINIQAVLLGGGINYGTGGGSSIYAMILWDVLHDPFYPYNSPIIRGGISIGI